MVGGQTRVENQARGVAARLSKPITGKGEGGVKTCRKKKGKKNFVAHERGNWSVVSQKVKTGWFEETDSLAPCQRQKRVKWCAKTIAKQTVSGFRAEGKSRVASSR